MSIENTRNKLRILHSLSEQAIRELCRQLVTTEKMDLKIQLGIGLGIWGQLGQKILTRRSELLDFEYRSVDQQIDSSLESLEKKVHEFLELRSSSATPSFLVADAPSHAVFREIDLLLRDYLSLTLKSAAIKEVDSFRPCRPANWVQSAEKLTTAKTNNELVGDPEQWRRFLHYVLVDVEVAAMDVCAAMILENPKMPFEFRLDLSRQTWDEARHAILIAEFLKATGTSAGDFSYSNVVIQRFRATSELASQLASQQVIQEGNALEVNCDLIEALRANGKYAEAEIFEFINADECEHVRTGNKWLKHLVGEREEYLQTMDIAARAIQIPAKGKGAWNEQLRSWSGCPELFIHS